MAAVDPCGKSPLGAVAVQEVRRSSAGWSTEQIGKWMLLSHQGDSEWRGTGILYDGGCLGIMRRLFSSKGTWFRLRHLQTRQEFWLGSLYLSPSLTTLDAHGYLAEHLNKLPATTLPVYLSGDTNASLLWAKTDEVTFPLWK